MAQDKLDPSDERLTITYDLLQTSLQYFVGRWAAIPGHNDDLVHRNLEVGEVWSASLHYYWHGFHYLYCGRLEDCADLVQKLETIVTVYENDLARLLFYILKAKWLVEIRGYQEANILIEKGIAFVQRGGFPLSLIDLYTCRYVVQRFNGDEDGARQSLERAERIRSEMDANPIQLCNLFKCQLEHNLHGFEACRNRGLGEHTHAFRRNALRAGRQLIRLSRKFAQHRTEGLQLMGTFYWLNDQPERAFKWWRRSIGEGRKIGASLALARCYREIGKRLADAPEGCRCLDGLDAKDYLDMARQMFQTMQLQWELG